MFSSRDNNEDLIIPFTSRSNLPLFILYKLKYFLIIKKNLGNLFSFDNLFTNLLRESIQNREENNIINQLYPNPDEMTYEQLLELQEKIGFVSKGISKEEKEV
jgi:hypothetical protein